jgi:hypothetical protein
MLTNSVHTLHTCQGDARIKQHCDDVRIEYGTCAQGKLQPHVISSDFAHTPSLPRLNTELPIDNVSEEFAIFLVHSVFCSSQQDFVKTLEREQLF